MLENVVVVGGYRTYIGKENGIYRHIPAEKLGGHILHKLSGDYGAPDLVLAGNAVGAGGNIGRLMALEAGIPEEVPAFTIDSQCSSGMEAIVMAAAKIGSGQQQVVFAGGAESSSTAPRRMVSENHPEYNGEKIYTAAKMRKLNKEGSKDGRCFQENLGCLGTSQSAIGSQSERYKSV